MFVDIHVQQTVPPSNLNRDDTGSPKSAIYGGVRRARVSSQAWKRATRAEFAERLQAGDLGFRTKRVIDLVVAEAGARGTDVSRDELAKRAEAALNAIGLKTEKAKDKAGTQEYLPVTQYLVLYSRGQIEALTDVILRDPKPSKKDVQAALGSTHGVEVALFGRMVADNKELSVDASVQVAHALSTHAVDDESDYFTAVDDLGRDDDAGAGMLGTIEFNSATLYRYATINVAGLNENLHSADDTARAVEAFIRDFALSMPTGKQNTFANNTLPDGVIVIVRRDRPVNLVGAFEDPVVPSPTSGIVSQSAERLVEQAHSTHAFVSEPVAAFVVHGGRRTAVLEELGDVCATVQELAAGVRGVVAASLGAAAS